MRRVARSLRQAALWAWASPWTAVGGAVAIAGLCCGRASVRVRRGAIETWGPLPAGLLRTASPRGPIAAMTLGHVIIGRSLTDLDVTCEHERVHVRQYERWGVLFVPLYLMSSAWCWVRGLNPYFDNVFEVEAFRESP